ncbi:MAG: dTDP-4-dehydrorhamnose reductase [Pseudomonadota bacterium]
MILVFGKTGQVATTLASNGRVQALDRQAADLSDPHACAAAIASAAPKAIINAAAYTAVDKAEAEERLATIVNGDAPAAMAKAAANLGVPFVHISTDYVFDGSGRAPWGPDDATGPVGAYGRSKLAGEEAVRAVGGTHAILRTSWVFSGTGGNFAKTMLRLGLEREEIGVVDDQIGGPTYAPDIAAACLTIADALIKDPDKSGTYHFTGFDDVAWADFAAQIFKEAGLKCQVNRIGTEDYPTPAARPLNSRLDCSSTEAAFGIARPTWLSGLRSMLAEMRG